jgi:hypothetical protein
MIKMMTAMGDIGRLLLHRWYFHVATVINPDPAVRMRNLVPSTPDGRPPDFARPNTDIPHVDASPSTRDIAGAGMVQVGDSYREYRPFVRGGIMLKATRHIRESRSRKVPAWAAPDLRNVKDPRGRRNALRRNAASPPNQDLTAGSGAHEEVAPTAPITYSAEGARTS